MKNLNLGDKVNMTHRSTGGVFENATVVDFEYDEGASAIVIVGNFGHLTLDAKTLSMYDVKKTN